APQIPNDTEVISFALVDQAGLFFPTDLKRVLPGETETLVVPAGSQSNYVVSVLVRKSDFSTTDSASVVSAEDLAPQDAFKDFMKELTADDPPDQTDNL